ncbi:unnamed protein product [Acanthoscelides obtectus]|uniref:Uncharacterized protein n=1 Tax=Acanthoscelides obtectus TaxID=200917 RepID=A0A9P0JKM8_ACAOB|nr:unnamed protein product [Acanthoscelides obtectus]CAK1672945.1 hypothetical protein AOBTE_LOCUS29148 [Acanthoscelides obtectus]
MGCHNWPKKRSVLKRAVENRRRNRSAIKERSVPSGIRGPGNRAITFAAMAPKRGRFSVILRETTKSTFLMTLNVKR